MTTEAERLAYRNAIANIESRGSGNYAALGPKLASGDRAYGRYQVMGSNIPQWTKAALGKAMTPEEFLKDQAAQDAVFDHRFGLYVQKYGPEKAARAWFGGEGSINKPGRQDVLGTSVATYGKKFMQGLGAPSAAGAPSAVGATPPASAGGALVAAAAAPASQPVKAIAEAFDTFTAAPRGLPSYAAEIAAVQNAPAPPSAGEEGDAWEELMLRRAAEDDAQAVRSAAVSRFFGEEPVPQIAIPESIDKSIERYLAQLS